MITGFDPLDPARAAIARDRYQQARDSGMTIGRVQFDWAEIETAPGRYDAQALDDVFDDPSLDGLNLYVTLSTLDSDGLTFPDHLLDDGRLREGLTLASPEVANAFAAFLDWLAPRLEARDVWALSLGNEVDSPVDDGVATQADASAFFTSGLSHWNNVSPQIAATVTLTIGAIDRQPQLLRAIRDQSDIVTFNYYCLDGAITVVGEDEWARQLARMKEAAGSREIFLQELGCPVGYASRGQPTSIGGSSALQQRFFEVFGQAIASDPQLRGATLFQLYDWSPDLARSFSDLVRDEGGGLAADRLEEWLATIGLVRWTEQTDRPAWSSWLAAIEAARAAREE